MDSILTSVKKLLNLSEDYEYFDADIIMHINSVLLVLNQLGIGPSEGFIIYDKTAIWDDFIGDAPLELVKSYMGLKVRLLFDPPQSSAAIESANRMISEFEWRLNVAVETPSHKGDE